MAAMLLRLKAPAIALALCFSGVLCAQETAPAAPQQNPAPEAKPGPWQSMFDGKTLSGWKETPFSGHGKVTIENGAIILGEGVMTGVNWAGKFPKRNYELRMEAQRIKGGDFFAGVTFPVFDTFCTWINGGWGGSLVGLSSLDDYDASENETATNRPFQNGRWYKLRLQVTDWAIAAWIDDEQVIYVELGTRSVGLRPGEIEMSKPFGIASFFTTAGLRNIEYRVLNAEESQASR